MNIYKTIYDYCNHKNILKEERMESINLPNPKEEAKKYAEMPGIGCRKVVPVQAYKYKNKYGVEKVHVDFNYKGYVFGQNFRTKSDLLYKMFNGVIDSTKLNVPIWVEIAQKVGRITGNIYPEIVDVADEF